jgi:small subunit ribosomal protein S17e
MGRIKTQKVKRITMKLYEEHADEFQTGFLENKKIVENFIDSPSKKLRNLIAGYITRLKTASI